MKKQISLFTFFFIVSLSSALAESEDLPKIILNGWHAYQSSLGARAAIDTWTKDGPLEGSKDLDSQADKLSEAESLFGIFENASFIKDIEFNRRSKLVFVTLNYHRGVLFAKFLAYRLNGDAGDWVVVDFDLDRDPEKILGGTLDGYVHRSS